MGVEYRPEDGPLPWQRGGTGLVAGSSAGRPECTPGWTKFGA